MIRPCAREACGEKYNDARQQYIPFVTVTVGDHYFAYCCPRCASVDLTERFRPKEFPL